MTRLDVPIPFGRYLLLEPIAAGGMAEIFKAKIFGIKGCERVVAIKRILPTLAEDAEFIDMFVDEARIAVQLCHPNIIPVYELDQIHGQLYIAMEYVSGLDLRAVLDAMAAQKRALPVPVIVNIVSQLCNGLDYAHRRTGPFGLPLHIVHRDVSPQNVLVSYDGVVKITDFGIARAENRLAEKTQAGVIKGKYGYMSPEQASGREVDRRTDIFAVGILLYEALTQKRLFVGGGDLATLKRVRRAEVTPPREIVPEIPEALEGVVLKALAREPDERYATAADLEVDLQPFLIEAQRIFDGKRLAMFLRENFAASVAAEEEALQAYLREEPPPAMAEAGRRDSGEIDNDKTLIDQPSVVGMVDNTHGGEVVYESDLDPQVSRPPPDPVQAAPGSPTDRRSSPKAAVVATPRWSTKRLVALAITAVALIFTIAILVKVASGPGGYGRLVVTSTPVNDVELLLDGELVSHQTPYAQDDIPVGEHTLVARAPGFRPRKYRFVLSAQQPAIMAVTLVPLPPAAQRTEPGDQEEVSTARATGEGPDLSSAEGAGRGSLAAAPDAAGTMDSSSGGDAAGDTDVAAAEEPDPILGWASVTVRSEPGGATVYYLGEDWGTTPVLLEDLDPNEVHTVAVVKAGYQMTYRKITFTPGALDRELTVRLSKKGADKTSSAGCSGNSGRLSVMTIGAQDCKVRVNAVLVGIAPFFKQPSPAGSCSLSIVCAGAKRYSTKLTIHSDQPTKLIVNSSMWQER